MAIGDTFSLVKTSSFPNGTTARLFHFLLPAGVIDSARIKIEGANTSDDVVFNLAIDGVAVTTTELTMASGTNEIEATGLAETVTNDQWATVSIDAPFTSGSLDGITAIGVHVTFVTQTVNLTGNQTKAGVLTFSSDPIIPDEAYDATNWNGVLEPPTKNAVRDKIEDILDGVTFTGDVVVPDEAYGVGWNGSLEVPTKNAVYDKIETVGSGSVATDAIFDALGDLAVGTGANTAAKLTVGTDGHFLSANSAEPTGLEWVALAGGGDLLSTNNLSDLADAPTALVNLGITSTAAELNILDGATLSVAELNLLDGVTASTAEINHIDGVTSAIQTQLDAKLASTATSIGKQTIYIPASAMIAATTSGPASAQQESATNDINYQTLAFDASADEHAHFNVAFPKSWNLSTVTFQVFWSSSATDTDGVAWGLQGIAISDNEAIDTAWGTAVVVTDDAQSAANELYVTAESGAVTIGGTPADDDLVYFRIFRDVSDANDDMTEDALLIGVKIFYTTDAGTDA